MKTIVAAAALAVAAAFVPGDALELRRDSADLWRVVTCHFTHWSYEQLAWDALAFIALGVACARRNGGAARATLLASVIVVPFAVLAFAPEVIAYRGLSGLASAMFALLLTLERNRLTMPVVAFGAGFLVKLALETITGGAAFASDMGEDVVAVPVAHLAGALAGVIGGLAGGRQTASRPARATFRTRPQLLLLAPLLLASCVTTGSQLTARSPNPAACKSADLTGEWYSRRTTVLGPAWVKLVLRRDCSYSIRMQLLFMRFRERGAYAIEGRRLRFERGLNDTVWSWRREKERLLLEETNGEWHAYERGRCWVWRCA